MNGSSIPTSQPPLRQPQLSIVPIPMNTPLPTTAELPVTMPVNSVPISWAQAPTNSIITTPSPVMVTSVNQPQPLVVNAGNPPVLLGSTSLQTQPTVNAVVTMNGPFATTPVSSGGTLTQQLNGSVSLPRSDITSVIVSQHSLPLQNNPAIISGSIPISASLAAPLPSLPSTPQAQPPVVTTSAESASRSAVIFTSKSLMELVKETDPHLQLDNETEETLTMLSEEFVENVAKKAIKMANHRGSPIVEAKDIKFCLDHDWNLFVPGFPTVEKNFKRPFILQAHKQRQALAKKQLKRT